MANHRKRRPKTRAQMRKLVEEIVLTEEDGKILDSVWDQMRRELLRKRRQEAQKKAASDLRELAKTSSELRAAFDAEVTDDGAEDGSV